MCAGLQGPLMGLFENAAMIVLLAAIMLLTAFWLPFTVGRQAPPLHFCARSQSLHTPDTKNPRA